MFTFSREKAPLDKRSAMLYLFAGVICLLSTLAYVYPSMRATSLMYDYSDRLRKLEKLKELNKKLRLETASLYSYADIERTAVYEFGFREPRPEQVVIIAKK